MRIDILAGYDNSSPPDFPEQTEITTYIDIVKVIKVDEKHMFITATLDITLIWMNAKLAYSDAISTKSTIDFSSKTKSVWIPQIQVTDNIRDEGTLLFLYSIDNLFDHLILYKNGTLYYNRIVNADLKCKFDFTKIPKDSHHCKFIFYALRYNKKYVKLNIGTRESGSEIPVEESVSFARSDCFRICPL